MTSSRDPLVLEQDPPIFSLKEPRYSQSLERGLAILGFFTAERTVLGIKDIAEGLGMSRSTTHRYVITLVALGYLEQGSKQKYRLGLGATDLGIPVLNSTGLREHDLCRPILKELRRRTSFTVSLAVLDGSEIVCVDRVRGFRQGQCKIDLGFGVGSRLPSYCTAIGKILLAQIAERERQELLSQVVMKRWGPSTIMSKSALHTELDRVFKNGFAIENEEFASDLIAIAAPVRNQTGEVIAAIDMNAHTSMIPVEELADALGPILITTAEHFSEHLGCPGGHESGA